MRDRRLQTWEIAQLIRRLRALAPEPLMDSGDETRFRFMLTDALQWAESGDPVRAVIDLAAAEEIAATGPPNMAEAHEMAGSILRSADWPRPLRIQYLSDLHVYRSADLVIPDTGADVLVVAGDIADTWEGLRWIVETSSAPHIVFTAGNHDPLGQDHYEYRHRIRLIEAENPTRIHVLENDVIELGNLVILGCTLWTDFELAQIDVDRALASADANMIEYQRVIDYTGWHGPRPVTPGQSYLPPTLSAATTRGWHMASRDWLDRTLRAYAGWQRLVVTHHAPHPESVTPRDGDRLHSWSDFAFDDWAPGAYASNCSELLEHADIWIHGHTHRVEDYTACGCRVLSNPARDETAHDPARCVELEVGP